MTLCNIFFKILIFIQSVNSGLSLSCVKCTYFNNVDLSQVTDSNTLALINVMISSSYSATSCNTATQGSSDVQVSDSTCQEPSESVRTGCLKITGSLIFTQIEGLPGVNVTSNVLHRDCANQTDWKSGCHNETQTNWTNLPWNQSFTLLHTLVSAGEFTGQVCITDIHGGGSTTENPGLSRLAFILVLHIVSFWKIL